MPPNTTLKQKLAALSLSPSSPATPYASSAQPRSPTRRRPLFAPPWKRQLDKVISGEQQARDLQDIMGRVVFQAGVDFE